MAQEKAEETKTRRQQFRQLIDDWLTGVFAGLSPRELRAMARGEPPGRPNPRYRVHNVSFWVHMKPRWYPKSVTRITYTFALGWLSAFLAVVLGLTGIVLMLFYTPSPDRAYFDMLNIMSNIPFGKAMRDLHRLGAELMVAIVTLHLVRVFITASYKQPRSFNWLVGMSLLAITLAFSFTGYLLPWDQLAFWAITIGTAIAETIPLVGTQLQYLLLGGPQVGDVGLLRFYTIHVLVLPVALAIAFAVHYHKVVRQTISLPPAVEAGDVKDSDRVSFLPDVLVREVLWVMLGALLMIAAVSTFYEAPLEEHANPFVTPLHSTAPWYFLWLQGLIKLPDIFGGIVEGKFVYGVILPGILVTLLLLLPYLDRRPHRRWQDRKIALAVFAVVVVAMGILTWMGTPAYKVEASAQEEVALDFVPFDRHGHIQEIPWEQLVPGTYNAAGYEEGQIADAPLLDEFMVSLREAIEHEADQLPDAEATLTIVDWQRELKRVDLDIMWQIEGEEHDFNQYVYVHENEAP